jgi:predicted N-acetyltransferase YhbS
MKSEITPTIINEQSCHLDAVEKLAAIAFGPGRFTRTAFRLREGVQSLSDLSFVCFLGEEMIGAIKLTDIKIGDYDSLLLGPLVVTPEYKSAGYGKLLMERAVGAARDAGHQSILLVGDEPYYGKFGFKKVKHGMIEMPGPVDPHRLLICMLQPDDTTEISGQARPAG